MKQANAARSKRGCQRCRDKKTKCDEVRPACGLCTRTRVQCPGYMNTIRWSRKHEVHPLPCLQSDVTGDHLSTCSQRSPTSHSPSPPSDPRSPPDNGQTASSVPDSSGNNSQTGVRSPSDHVLASSPLVLVDFTMANSPYEPQPPPPEVPQTPISQTTIEVSPNGPTQSQAGCFNAASVTDSISPGGSFDYASSASDDLPAERSRLLRHFFDVICPLQSVFEDPNNVFVRHTFNYLGTSALISNCVLSLSAAHYSRSDKSRFKESIGLLSDAVNALVEAIGSLETSGFSAKDQANALHCSQTIDDRQVEEALFASLLLGLYSPYNDAQDLGLPYLQGARKLCQWWFQYHTSTDGNLSNLMLDEDKNFIIGAMAYWEAHMAFVVDQPLHSVDYLLPFIHNPSITLVHPFSGVATPIFIMLAQVGICIRQQRLLKKLQDLCFPPPSIEEVQQQVMDRVTRLELWLLDFNFPCENEVQGLEESSTSLREVMCYGEIYFMACIVELYRSFPSLGNSSHRFAHFTSLQTYDLTLSPHRTQNLCVDARHFHRREDLLNLSVATLLGLIEELPETHPSCPHQTLALIIAGSVLHLSPTSDDQVVPRTSNRASDTWFQMRERVESMSMRPSAIVRWRNVISRRLVITKTRLNTRIVSERAERILKGVWSNNLSENLPPRQVNQFDSVNRYLSGPYWLDIMTDLRLETIFG